MAARRTTRRNTTSSLDEESGDDSSRRMSGASSAGMASPQYYDSVAPSKESEDLLSEQFRRQVSLQQQQQQQQQQQESYQASSSSSSSSSGAPPSPLLAPLVPPPPLFFHMPGTHKRELSSPSINRLSSVNSVEMLLECGGPPPGSILEPAGSNRASSTSTSLPSTKRSNGNDTPMGIRALKQSAPPQSPADSALYSFAGAAFQPPPPSQVHPEISAAMSSRTLVIYPPVCLQHETLNHQESVDRLVCLVDPQKGVLRRKRFANLEWAETNIAPATTSDLLRVHEYDYIRHLRSICNSLPPVPHHHQKLEKEGGGGGGASSLLATLPAEFQPQNLPTQPPPELLRPSSLASSTSPAPSSSGAPSPTNDEDSAAGEGSAYNATSSSRSSSSGSSSSSRRAPADVRRHTSIRDFPVDLLEALAEGREEDEEEGGREGGGARDEGGQSSSSSSPQQGHGPEDRGGEAFEKKERAGSLPQDEEGKGIVSQFLDSDTRVCRDSFQVACIAAGAVIAAVDQAAAGRKRTFVATRPPGHHAGPRGAVPSHCFWKSPSSCSSGFCLLNNVAIGAAYARQTYGRPPSGQFARIAIVDFDVHHGNGSEACVRALRPSRLTLPLPASWAPQSYELFKPWLSEESDADNVFFGSINLVDGPHFYPCSGREVENDEINHPNIINVELSPIRPTTAAPGSSKAKGLGPRKVKEFCQRASDEFREKVGRLLLPKLKAFGADLLFISAGFDGHVDDFYHYLTDDDFAWLTRELVGIMELTSGKIISVLEGGYHTRAEGGREGGLGVGKRLPGRPAGSRGGGKQGSAAAVSDDDEGGGGGGAGGEGGGGGESHINLETDGGLAKGVMAHVLSLMDDASMLKMKM